MGRAGECRFEPDVGKETDICRETKQVTSWECPFTDSLMAQHLQRCLLFHRSQGFLVLLLPKYVVYAAVLLLLLFLPIACVGKCEQRK